MYFGKNFKKIKRILKEENIVVGSSNEEKEILKFITYELESGERYNSIINNKYVEDISCAKKFLTRFKTLAENIEHTDFSKDYKDLASDIRFEFERGNSKAPISVCGKYAHTAIKYESEYYKALEYIDYCFASGTNLDFLSSDDTMCWILSHIYELGDMIDINTLNAMTITSNLINQTGSDASGYIPKTLTRNDYLNGTAAHLRLTTCLMNKQKDVPTYEFYEAVYGKDAADVSREIF